MIELSGAIFPGCVVRWPGENGLRIWVEGEPADPAARVDAVARFQTLLGVLRAWRVGAGELREELRAGLGDGSVRDEAGNQFVLAHTALAHVTMGDEIAKLAASVGEGIGVSQNLRNALWLNGRLNRTAADFYMIYEYAQMEFGSPAGVKDVLGLSTGSQSRLTRAANNLSPLDGGRHAEQSAAAGMTLDEQRSYIAELLRLWIQLY